MLCHNDRNLTQFPGFWKMRFAQKWKLSDRKKVEWNLGSDSWQGFSDWLSRLWPWIPLPARRWSVTWIWIGNDFRRQKNDFIPVYPFEGENGPESAPNFLSPFPIEIWLITNWEFALIHFSPDFLIWTAFNEVLKRLKYSRSLPSFSVLENEHLKELPRWRILKRICS